FRQPAGIKNSFRAAQLRGYKLRGCEELVHVVRLESLGPAGKLGFGNLPFNLRGLKAAIDQLLPVFCRISRVSQRHACSGTGDDYELTRRRGFLKRLDLRHTRLPAIVFLLVSVRSNSK